MKCDICKANIETTFLKKIIGTVVIKKGKKKYVCSKCQKQYNDKILEKL